MDNLITDTALALPMTFVTEQWMGAQVFKVGTSERFKMFAILRPGSGEVTVKCPDGDTRDLLIEAGVARAHSHLPRGGWAVLLCGEMEADDILARVEESYEVVRASLPKAFRRGV